MAAVAFGAFGCGGPPPSPPRAVAASPPAHPSPPPPAPRAAPEPAEHPSPRARRATLRYELKGRKFPLPLVRGTVAGIPTWMLVDTGANSHVVAGWLAR